MNYRIITYVIGWVLNLEAICMTLPAVTGLIYGEKTWTSFLITGLISALAGTLLVVRRPEKPHFFMKEGCVSVALSWIALSLIGSLPFMISGTIPHFVDALFETVSGFTTTGASIMASVEDAPRCILMWRSFTHWIGGMGVPAVAQMSYYDKEQKDKYLAEAVRQFLQFADRMFIPEKGLYRHGWVESSTDHPAFCWARANGWAMLTACELLDVLPEDYPQRAKVMDYFRAHVRGVTALQSGEGLWHQLLDRNDSYLETSATAIYVYCLAHAINKGWIDAIAYGPVTHLGWHAVAGKINAEGQVEGTCVGTGMAFDPAFYYYRPVNVYAAHGYGPVLWAGAEMISLLKNQYPQMNDSAVQYYQVKQKTTAPIFAIDTEEKKD